MIDFLLNYANFLLKTATIVVGVLFVLGFIFSQTTKRKSPDGFVEVTDLNEEYDDLEECLSVAVLDEHQQKAHEKEKKQKEKQEKKTEKSKKKKHKRKFCDFFKCKSKVEKVQDKKRIYVVSFDGDMDASEVSQLREEITAILTFADKKDEVLAIVESEGGLVHSYGLAASQLQRVRDHGMDLTVAIDKVAASGGYLMACVANKIIAAPFAVVGSIGVIAELPNFNRVITEKLNVDYEQHTAGEYKRTLTLFGKNTDTARKKFKEELEETHDLFKKFVHTHRPKLDLKKVATGEHWYGEQAIKLNLVDKLMTSDDYLLSNREDAKLFMVEYVEKQSLSDKLQNLSISLAKFAYNTILQLNRKQNI